MSADPTITENQLVLQAAELEEEFIAAKAAWVAADRPAKGPTREAKVAAGEKLREHRQAWREVRDAFELSIAEGDAVAAPNVIKAKATTNKRGG